MLELKSRLTTTAAHSQTRLKLFDLPSEVLDEIVRAVYEDGDRDLSTILPASRTCRALRTSALPLLFESYSCSIRERTGDILHPSFSSLQSNHQLLRHVKLLHFQTPLRVPCNPAVYDKPEVLERKRLEDVEVIKRVILQIPSLRTIRFRCTIQSAVDVLRIVEKSLHIVLDQIVSVEPHFSDRDAASKEMVRIAELRSLLRQHNVSISTIELGPYQYDDSDVEYKSMSALHLYTDLPSRTHSNVDVMIPGPTELPFLPVARSCVKELWLVMFTKRGPTYPTWLGVLNLVNWSDLQKLSMEGPQAQVRLNSILPELLSLRCLHLRSSGFHQNCSYRQLSTFSDVNYPYLDIDFNHLPHLKSLSIEGHCNHLPVSSVVTPILNHLRLHRPHCLVSTASPQSQRTASDMVLAAKLAPLITHLELDINRFESLWHPTAIPGVDVDVDLYSFLSSISKFKHLRSLRLFPPYVTRASVAAGLSWNNNHGGFADVQYAQPCSDLQAIKLFNYLRAQNKKLVTVCINPADGFGKVDLAALSRPLRFMRWEVKIWGKQTMMTTREQDSDYELRQIWEGERKIRTETKKKAYSNDFQYDKEDEWILRRERRIMDRVD